MPSTLRMDEAFAWSVQNVAKWGDTDVFPLLTENHVFHDLEERCVDLLHDIVRDHRSRLDSNPPVNQSTLAPAGYVGFRWATQIDPIWNAYLLGLVLSLHQHIEAYRLSRDADVAFSYHVEKDSDSPDIFRTDEWAMYRDASRSAADECQFVVQTDIADFYSRIYHHRLENALNRLGHPGGEHAQIMELLGTFSNGASYGIPVGGPAARILSEVVLTNVDNLLVLGGVRHMRFADDYLMFVDSREEAYERLAFLSEKLQMNEGLSLQKAKTRVMSSTEFVDSLDAEVADSDDRDRPFVRLSLHFDPYSPTALEDYAALKAQIERFDIAGMLGRELAKTRVRPGLFRRLVRALGFLEEAERDAGVLSLLENLERLLPLLPTILRAIRNMYPELGEDVKHAVDQDLIERITSRSHLFSLDLNLSYAVRVLAASDDQRAPAVFAALYDNVPAFVRSPLLVAMARWEQSAFVSDRRSMYSNMHPWEKRAFLMGSYILGDEGRHWRQRVRSQVSPFDQLVLEWMSQQSQRPEWEIPI